MKTLISIIENSPGTKTTFGSDLSKKTGIPVFDLSTYRAKYGPEEAKVWANLLNDVGMSQNVILDNANAQDALTYSQKSKFDKKIVFLPHSQSNILTFGWLGEISKTLKFRTWHSNTNCPMEIQKKANFINEMGPDNILLENPKGQDSFWIYKIKESILK